MVATLLPNRLGYDSPPPAMIALPQSAGERGSLWSDAVFAAVMTLKNQLSSRNEAVAAAAANSILELERTRMRHDKTVAGSCLPEAEPFPEIARRPHEAAPLDEVPAKEVECLQSHAMEVMDELLGRDGQPMTMNDAVRAVTGILRKIGAKPSDVGPGDFIALYGKHLREKAASAVPD